MKALARPQGLSLRQMDSTTRPIDVDNPETWPVEVVDWVRPEAERLRGSTIYTGDLDVSLELEDEFRQLLTRPLVAYHCTRLLATRRRRLDAKVSGC